jgi:hypothetical protein
MVLAKASFAQRQLRQIVAICVAGLLWGCDGNRNNVNPPASPGSPAAVAEAGFPFVKSRYDASGTVRVEGGSRLVFSDRFQTSNGPDLFVILHREATPQNYSESQYTIIGRLQKDRGAQTYNLPNSVKIGDYRSVVIWCRQFNVTFSYATIK